MSRPPDPHVLAAVPPDGIWFLDKPTSWTSHDLVAWIRGRTGIQRVGHAGTLDPLATGLLIVLVGRAATKRQTEFLKLDKEYSCVMRLGFVSSTYDRDGQLSSTATWDQLTAITPKAVQHVFESFIGDIDQQVPLYSSVKVAGRSLHRIARAGEQLSTALPVKRVHIHSIHIDSFNREVSDHTLDIHFTVACGSGTYVRSLVHDVGQKLKVGAIVQELRRTKIGSYTIENAQQFPIA